MHDSTQYAFTIVRPNSNLGYYRDVAERSIHLRSVYFMKVAMVVMQAQKNVAGDANPVKVSTIFSVLCVESVERFALV